MAELPPEIDDLVRESEAEGFAFVARLRDDWNSGENRFDAPGEGFFVCRVDDVLVGVCALNRDPFAGDPSCGRFRRFYVSPGMRRRGAATALAIAVLELAREHFSVVRLRTHNPDAVAFYSTLGFRTVGSSADATHELQLK